MVSIAQLRATLQAHGGSVRIARFRSVAREPGSYLQVHLDFQLPGHRDLTVVAGSLPEALDRASEVLANAGVGIPRKRNRYCA